MKKAFIIMPVKDSMETTLKSIEFICSSKGVNPFFVYNDRSLPENREILEDKSSEGFTLINIEDEVDTPSPNYLYVLIEAQKKALEINADLMLVESDVFVQPDTIKKLLEYSEKLKNAGMIAAITTDEKGFVNFPYLHIKQQGREVIETKHRLSFCCTLLTCNLLRNLDFEELPKDKHWFDVTISSLSRKAGFSNYILPQVKVFHQPHSSRPWKKLKYSNPLRYYIKKLFLRRDRI